MTASTFLRSDATFAAVGVGDLPALATTNLTDVSSGVWTPADASGAGLVFTGVSAAYTKIGNMVFAYGRFTYPATANGAAVLVSGLPFTVANSLYASIANTTFIAGVAGGTFFPVQNTTRLNGINSSGGSLTNGNLSLALCTVNLVYPVT